MINKKELLDAMKEFSNHLLELHIACRDFLVEKGFERKEAYRIAKADMFATNESIETVSQWLETKGKTVSAEEVSAYSDLVMNRCTMKHLSPLLSIERIAELRAEFAETHRDLLLKIAMVI